MGFEGLPYIIGWEFTLACNLNCIHCGSMAGSIRSNELSLSEGLAICDQLPDLLVQEVNFTGGEPLLRKDFFPIVSHLNELGISVKILTNGILLNSKIINQMKELSIAGIGISLDGLPSTQDRLRKHSGIYNQVMTAISNVIEMKIPLTIITTVNAVNLAELPDLMDILISKGVKHWQLQPLFPLGNSTQNKWLQLSSEGYLRFGNFIAQNEKNAQIKGLEIMASDSFGYFTFRDSRYPPWRGCPAGIYTCGITSNGMIKGCLSLPDSFVEGNLRKRTFWDIWVDEHSFTYNRHFSKKKLGINCKNCKYENQCRGGCSAMSIGCTGKFHNDPLCFYSIEKIDEIVL